MMTTRSKILSGYAACGASALLASVPSYAVQDLSFLVTLVTLIALYIVRARENLDSLEYQHFSFMIRTVWIYSLIAAVCVFFATFHIYQTADSSAIDALLSQSGDGAMPDIDQFRASSDLYMRQNKTLILETMIYYMFPALLYMLWRVTRGSLRAYKNYRVHNIYSWF